MGADLRGQEQTRRLMLLGTGGVVGRCRDFTERALGDWGWTPAPGVRDEKAEDVLLLVSELVTNACLHAGGPTELVLRHSPERLRIEVADASPERPRPRPRDIARPGGHGLIVLRRLSRDWGAEARGDGKVVWAEVAPPAAAGPPIAARPPIAAPPLTTARPPTTAPPPITARPSAVVRPTADEHAARSDRRGLGDPDG